MKEFFLIPVNMWLAAVMVLVCVELLVDTRLYLTMLALAAFVTSMAARTSSPLYAQLLVFAGMAALFILKARRPLHRWRTDSLKQTSEALSHLRSTSGLLMDPIPSSTVPGKVLVEGVPDEIRGSADVQAAYLGAPVGGGDEEETT